MDIKEINENLRITDFLASQGILPDKPPVGRSVKYISPIRAEERTASFSVDVILNRWKDFGDGRGGNLFDLATTLFPNKTNREVLQMLNRMAGQALGDLSPEARQVHERVTKVQQNPTLPDTEIHVSGYSKLTSPALFDYIRERRVAENVANQFFKQVYYRYKGKDYFAIGLQTDAGGFALRNKYVKFASKPNGPTFIDNGMDTVALFEGLFDFASYATLKQYMRLPETNYLILNGTAFIHQNRRLLEAHRKVFCFLDHSKGANDFTTLMKSWDAGKFWDGRKMYAGSKDLNAWLIDNLDKVMLQHAKREVGKHAGRKPLTAQKALTRDPILVNRSQGHSL